MDPILLQKQIRDNSQDLQNFMLDLKNWENEMKRKDKELQEQDVEQDVVPPVRSKIKKVSETNQTVSDSKLKEKRLSSYDYSAWDKFDVDKACADIDEAAEEKEESEDELIQKINENQLREQAVYEKELGNQHVKAQKWKEAIECYSRAIGLYAYDAAFYANRALCYLKTKNYKLAETDCTTAIQLDKTYVKAYQRRALAKVEIGQIQEAKVDFKKVLELEPNNIAATTELMKLDKRSNPEVKQSKRDLEEIQKEKKNVHEKLPAETVKEEVLIKEIKQCVHPQATKVAEENILTNSNDEIILPVQKPPHLRSKKPLKSIAIEEVENEDEFKKILCVYEAEHCKSNLTDDDKGQEAKIKVLDCTDTNDSCVEKQENKICHVSHQSDKPCVDKLACGDKTSTSVKSKCPNEIASSHKPLKESGDTAIELPPTPKTSVQFLVSWKVLENNDQLRYQFLKQIPSAELPTIFQDALESREFSDIISILSVEFVKRNEPVHNYLMSLSEVRRFSTLVMFMTKHEKTEMKNLLQYCEKNGECTKEVLEELSRRYEISKI